MQGQYPQKGDFDARQLNDALRRLGWSRAELGRRINLHPNTISRWGDKVPGPVAAYLRLAVRANELL